MSQIMIHGTRTDGQRFKLPIETDRVPTTGEYVLLKGRDLFRVDFVVFTSGRPTVADVFARQDKDRKLGADEAGGRAEAG